MRERGRKIHKNSSYKPHSKQGTYTLRLDAQDLPHKIGSENLQTLQPPDTHSIKRAPRLGIHHVTLFEGCCKSTAQVHRV